MQCFFCFVAFHTEQIACVRLRKKVLARAKVLTASAKLSIPSTWDFSMHMFQGKKRGWQTKETRAERREG